LLQQHLDDEERVRMLRAQRRADVGDQRPWSSRPLHG